MTTTTTIAERSTEPFPVVTLRRRRWRRLRFVLRRPEILGAWMWLAVVVILALVADVLPVKRFDKLFDLPMRRPAMTWPEFLGTDRLGRSNLSRVIYGTRVSLIVGLVATLGAVLVGGSLGLLAGYFRGRVEAVIDLFVDSTLAFPPLILLLALTSVARQTLPTLCAALGLLGVPAITRLARANTVLMANREFVQAARAAGASHARIIVRELLPNVALPVASYAFVVLANVMVAEGSLSFLGLGIPPPQPSWGGMIAAGRDSLATDPHLVFVPAVAMLLTVLSFNVIGNHARSMTDVRQSVLT